MSVKPEKPLAGCEELTFDSGSQVHPLPPWVDGLPILSDPYSYKRHYCPLATDYLLCLAFDLNR
jgi:hypothetical protein